MEVVHQLAASEGVPLGCRHSVTLILFVTKATPFFQVPIFYSYPRIIIQPFGVET